MTKNAEEKPEVKKQECEKPTFKSREEAVAWAEEKIREIHKMFGMPLLRPRWSLYQDQGWKMEVEALGSSPTCVIYMTHDERTDMWHYVSVWVSL